MRKIGEGMDNQQKFEFITEKVKERPINKKNERVVRSSLDTVASWGFLECQGWLLSAWTMRQTKGRPPVSGS